MARIAAADEQHESGPNHPWVGEHLSDELYNESWRRFSAWVGWLEEAYAPWAMLPDCWPAHGACVPS